MVTKKININTKTYWDSRFANRDANSRKRKQGESQTMDFSSVAIEQYQKKFGNMATFICGDVNAIPCIDSIITSNVLGHLSDDKEVAKKLLNKCKELYIAVPYNEKISGEGEHINSYNTQSFDNKIIDG
jgi:hypothetical protein